MASTMPHAVPSHRLIPTWVNKETSDKTIYFFLIFSSCSMSPEKIAEIVAMDLKQNLLILEIDYEIVIKFLKSIQASSHSHLWNLNVQIRDCKTCSKTKNCDLLISWWKNIYCHTKFLYTLSKYSAIMHMIWSLSWVLYIVSYFATCFSGMRH